MLAGILPLALQEMPDPASRMDHSQRRGFRIEALDDSNKSNRMDGDCDGACVSVSLVTRF